MLAPKGSGCPDRACSSPLHSMANRCGTNGCCSGSAALMPHQQSHTAADAQLCHVPQPVSIHNPAQDTAACRHPLRPNVSSYSSVHRSRPWAAAAALRVGYLLLLAAMLVPQVQARKRALQAAAQPCIECSQCLTAACQRICTPSCRAGRPGVAIALNGDQCRSRGEDAADSVADDACKSAQVGIVSEWCCAAALGRSALQSYPQAAVV